MATNLKVYVNTGSLDSPLGSSGVEFTEISTANDYLVESNGSDVVKDGEAIPTDTQLNQAGVVIDEVVAVVVPKYFLADISANLLREIHNMGNTIKRYVFAFDFDGVTATEPVLELWDDSDLDTVALFSLGNGTPSNSWWKGVVTTDSAPSPDWAGSALAGNSDGHFLQLNNGNGALIGAKTLYCNIKIVVPAGASQGGADNPIWAVKWTSN